MDFDRSELESSCEEAMAFTKKLERFSKSCDDNHRLYTSYINIMKSYRNGLVTDSKIVLEQVREIFAEHPGFLREFGSYVAKRFSSIRFQDEVDGSEEREAIVRGVFDKILESVKEKKRSQEDKRGVDLITFAPSTRVLSKDCGASNGDGVRVAVPVSVKEKKWFQEDKKEVDSIACTPSNRVLREDCRARKRDGVRVAIPDSAKEKKGLDEDKEINSTSVGLLGSKTSASNHRGCISSRKEPNWGKKNKRLLRHKTCTPSSQSEASRDKSNPLSQESNNQHCLKDFEAESKPREMTNVRGESSKSKLELEIRLGLIKSTIRKVIIRRAWRGGIREFAAKSKGVLACIQILLDGQAKGD